MDTQPQQTQQAQRPRIDYASPQVQNDINELADMGLWLLLAYSCNDNDGQYANEYNSRNPLEQQQKIVQFWQEFKTYIPEQYAQNKQEFFNAVCARMTEMQQNNEADESGTYIPNWQQIVNDAYRAVNEANNNTSKGINRNQTGRQTYSNPNIQPKPIQKRVWPHQNGAVRFPVGGNEQHSSVFYGSFSPHNNDGYTQEQDEEAKENANTWRPTQEMINSVYNRPGYYG